MTATSRLRPISLLVLLLLALSIQPSSQAAFSSSYLGQLESGGNNNRNQGYNINSPKKSYAPGSGVSPPAAAGAAFGSGYNPQSQQQQQHSFSAENSHDGALSSMTLGDEDDKPTTAASTSTDYLSALTSGTGSSQQSSSSSFAPGKQQYKFLKETGFLGGLSPSGGAAADGTTSGSAPTTYSGPYSSSVAQTSPAASASTSDYLSRMSSSSSVADGAKKSSYAPGASKWKSGSATTAESEHSGAPKSDYSPAASTTDYLSSMSKGSSSSSSTAASTSKQSSFAPGGSGSSKFKQIKETGFLAGLGASTTLAAPSYTTAPSTSPAPRNPWQSNTPSESEAAAVAATTTSGSAASTSDYLSSMSKGSSSPETASKQVSFAPGGGAGRKFKEVKETGFLAGLSAAPMPETTTSTLTAAAASSASSESSSNQWQSSASENANPASAVTTTSDYLSSVSKGSSSSRTTSKQSSFAPGGGGGKFKQAKETGFLAGLGYAQEPETTPAPTHTTAPSHSTSNGISSNQWQSSASEDAKSASVAPTACDYLSSMSKRSSSPGTTSKQSSYAPGGGKSKYKQAKETGFLAGLCSAQMTASTHKTAPTHLTSSPTPSNRWQSSATESSASQGGNLAPVTATTSDYLSSMSKGSSSSWTTQKHSSFAPGGGGGSKFKQVKETGFLAGLSSAPLPEKLTASTHKTAPTHSTASPTPSNRWQSSATESSASQGGNSAPVTATTSDYLSSMSKGSSSSGTTQKLSSFAPGGGGGSKFKQVKETGFLAGLSSAPLPEKLTAPTHKTAPTHSTASPTPSNRWQSSATESSASEGGNSAPVTATTSDYLSSMSKGSSSSWTTQKHSSFAPGSGGGSKFKQVKETGFLAGLSSAPLPEKLTAPTHTTAPTHSTSSPTPSNRWQSGATESRGGGSKFEQVKETGFLAGLGSGYPQKPLDAPRQPTAPISNSAKPAQDSSSSWSQSSTPTAPTTDYFSSMSKGTSPESGAANKKSFAPGAGSKFKQAKETGFLAGLGPGPPPTIAPAHSAASVQDNQWQPSPPQSSTPSASTTDYLNSMSKGSPSRSSGTTSKQSFAPGAGSKFKQAKETGFLAGLGSSPPARTTPTPAHLAASAQDNQWQPSPPQSSTPSVSTTDYLHIMSKGSASRSGTTSKQSFAPGAGSKFKQAKETGFLAGLGSSPPARTTPTPAHLAASAQDNQWQPSPPQSSTPSVSTTDYLHIMSKGSASRSGTTSKQSFAPGAGSKFKQAKETGFLAGLGSSPPARTTPAPAPSTPDPYSATSAQDDSWKPSLSQRSSTISTDDASSNTPSKQHSSQRGSNNRLQSSPSMRDAAASTNDYLSAMSRGSASYSKGSFAPGGRNFKTVKETGFLASLSQSASAQSYPAASLSSSVTPQSDQNQSSPAGLKAVSASTSDYLSAMSGGAASSSARVKSYAPGGGKLKPVKETGFLAGLSVVPTEPSYPVYDNVQQSGQQMTSLSGSSGTQSSANSGQSYTGALSRAPDAIFKAEMPYSHSSSKSEPIKETEFLAGHSSANAPRLHQRSGGSDSGRLSADAFSTDTAVASATDYLSLLTKASLSAKPKLTYAPFGVRYRQARETGYLASLSSQATTANTFAATHEPRSSAPSGLPIKLPSESMYRSISAMPAQAKSYAPGSGQFKQVKETGFLAGLSSAKQSSTFSDSLSQSNGGEGRTASEFALDDDYLTDEYADSSSTAFPADRFNHPSQYRASAMPESYGQGQDAPSFYGTLDEKDKENDWANVADSFPPSDMGSSDIYSDFASESSPEMYLPEEPSSLYGYNEEYMGEMDPLLSGEPFQHNSDMAPPASYRDFQPRFESSPPLSDYYDSGLDGTNIGETVDDVGSEGHQQLLGFSPYVVDQDLQGATLVDYSLHTEIENARSMDDKLIVLQRLGGHNLDIESFEIELAADSAGDFGWTMYDTDYFQGNLVVDNGYIAGSLFAGPEQPAEVTFYSTENDERIKTTTFIRRGDKTIIRCANRGAEWYVNGQLVATTPEFSRGICSGGVPAPYVGIQTGSFHFTKLDFVQRHDEPT